MIRRVIRAIIDVNKSHWAILSVISALPLSLVHFSKRKKRSFVSILRFHMIGKVRCGTKNSVSRTSPWPIFLLGAADASLFIAHQSAILVRVPCASHRSFHRCVFPRLRSWTSGWPRLWDCVSIIKFQFLDEEEKKRRKISASINYVDNNFQIEESEEREMCRVDELKIIARLR